MKLEKRELLVAFALIAAAFAGLTIMPAASHAASQSNPAAGRFVLFSAKYESVVAATGKTGAVESLGLFRLDTATGKTWTLTSGVDDAGLVTRWDPVDEGSSR